MASLGHFLVSSLQNVKHALTSPSSVSHVSVRNAAKKSSTSTRNKPLNLKPKHRGWKVQDGQTVTAGKWLVTQRTTRFHPGLHVGFGKNGTLFAMEPGKVVITCEKVDLNWDHTWIQRCYAGRTGETFYKKYFNVIPEKQHDRFKLVDTI